MRLEEIAVDETAPVSGFQRHTFKCSSCGDVEERLAFVKEHSQANAVASAPENEDEAASRMLVGIIGVISGKLKVPDQAARSIC
jgi:hypothetical protein